MLLLMIEDDEALLEVSVQLLQLHGFEVVAAARGQTGLNLAKSIKPDCVLVDLTLPDFDGFQVLQRLNEDPGTACIPVIILSGHIQEKAKDDALALGASAYIVKPYDIDQLISTIHQVVARS